MRQALKTPAQINGKLRAAAIDEMAMRKKKSGRIAFYFQE
jgi:hypothetical protein